MLRALEIAQNVTQLHEGSAPRLWLPRLSWEWLGSAPKTYISEDKRTLSVGRMAHMDMEYSPEAREKLTMSSSDNIHISERNSHGLGRQYIRTESLETDSMISVPLVEKAALNKVHARNQFTWHRVDLIFAWAWRTRSALKIRLWLSKVLRSVKHSSHLRHAFKNAVGVALLSLPAFFPKGSAGKWPPFSVRSA